MIAPIGQPSDIAVSVKPATSADRFKTPCTYMGRNAVRPISAIPANRVAAFAVAIGRRAQSPNATIGSAALRSWSTNSQVATAQDAAEIKTAGPDSPNSVSATISAATAIVNSTAPGTSTRRTPEPTRSCRNSTNRQEDPIPTGKLIQNTHAQLRCSTISPPASGPSTEETPQTLER